MAYIRTSIIKKIYKTRDKWSHKGNYGKLLVIGGSEVHTGSPIFVGLAAYRAGADLVFLVGPQRPMDMAASYSPLLITHPLPGKQLELKHIQTVVDMADDKCAVVIGPGLWRTKTTRQAIIEIVKRVNLPMVVDADAIRALSAAKHLLAGKDIVLTPHADEFRELTGEKPSLELKKRSTAVQKHAKKLKTTILLKGHVDVISNGTKTILNKTGSPFMTVGGMGDTLAGICGALLARDVHPFLAAQAAAYINGRSGQLASKKYGEGVITTDLIGEIPRTLR